MDPRMVGQILTRCLGYRPGESVLVVADAGREEPAGALVRGARDAGADPVLLPVEVRAGIGPSPALIEALRGADLALLATSVPLDWSEEVREIVSLGRLRAVSFGGLDAERIDRLAEVDYDGLARKLDDLTNRLGAAGTVELKGEEGTDLAFRPAPAGVRHDLDPARAPGRIVEFPVGALMLPVEPGSARGVVYTGAAPGRPPIRLEFRDGLLTEASETALRAASVALPGGPYGPGEIEFGMNPQAAPTGSVGEARRAAGTIHLVLAPAGRPAAGSVAESFRLPLAPAAVLADGRPVPREVPGAPVKSTTRRRTKTPMDDVPGGSVLRDRDMFRFMFENANDPQYIIDLESQRFLEVNPAFEKLTGWTRTDLVDGQVPASRLIAQESLSSFEVKIESRRQMTSDRYDMLLLGKDGHKIPVEFSVKRVSHDGRDVVIGALRDLTERRRLEQERREKLQELGYANTRIYAITEKVRRIPEFTPLLLNVASEEDLLRQAAELLCERRGMAYRDVNVYLQQGDALELAFSTQGHKRRRIPTDAGEPIGQVFRGNPARDVNDERALFPLKGREQTLGVLEVFFEPKELQVLRGNARAEKSYQDILEAVSEMLGLLLENLRLYETVRMQSIVDQLTGVYNRRFFDGKLADEVNRARRYSRSLSVAMVDVDHFKEINDGRGHPQGDLALTTLAAILRANTRETDYVCRYGGDEFAILMPETNSENAMVKAEALLQIVRRSDIPSSDPGGAPVRVTLSLGVADHQPGMTGEDELLRAADEALYRAKRDGRNRVYGAVPARSPKPA